MVICGSSSHLKGRDPGYSDIYSHNDWWIIVQEICRYAINMFPKKHTEQVQICGLVDLQFDSFLPSSLSCDDLLVGHIISVAYI